MIWYAQVRMEGLSSLLAEMPTGRPDAHATLFGPGHEHVLLNTAVQDGSRRCVRVGNTGLRAYFQQHRGLPIAVQEHQRRARYAVNRAVVESPARCETALMMELRAPQLNTESLIQKTPESLFRIGNEAQAALGQQRAHMLTEHEQLVLEGDAHRIGTRHELTSERRDCKIWQLEKSNRDQEINREEPHHDRDMSDNSKMSARIR